MRRREHYIKSPLTKTGALRLLELENEWANSGSGLSFPDWMKKRNESGNTSQKKSI